MAEAMLLQGEDYEGGTSWDDSAGQIASAGREVYEIMCVTKGWAEYWVEDQHYKLSVGDVMLIPAGTMVGATLKQRGCPFERHAVWMSRKFMTFLKLQDTNADYAFKTAEQNHRYVMRLPQDVFENLAAAFEALSDECADGSFNSELSCKALLSSLIVQINRVVEDMADDIMIPGDSNRLSTVLSYIHDNCTQPLTVDMLAEMFDYSPSHLAHSFKKQMGISLYQYVLVRRLQIGREAMLDGVPVKEAYQACGFGDYAGFYRAFTKEFGVSPQQYKKRNQ